MFYLKNFNTEKFLILIYIFRVVPINWVYSLKNEIAEDYARYAQTKLFNLVHNSTKKLGYLLIKENAGDKYLYLTTKGYNKCTQILEPLYNYQYWRSNVNRIANVHRNHNYLMFRFVLNLLEVFPPKIIEKIYLYHDNSSKLRFSTSFVDPDILLKIKGEDGNNWIAVEADTGSESHGFLFDKILKYLLFMKSNIDDKGIKLIRIYFVFGSSDRENGVFNPVLAKSKSNLLDFVREDVWSFKKEKIRKSLTKNEVLEVLSQNKIQIMRGQASQPFGSYKLVDLAGIIRKNDLNEKLENMKKQDKQRQKQNFEEASETQETKKSEYQEVRKSENKEDLKTDFSNSQTAYQTSREPKKFSREELLERYLNGYDPADD